MSGYNVTGYYELVYENKKYYFLEFIRLDTICEVSYVTLKNVVTGEMFTFEESKINRLNKRFMQLTFKNNRRQKLAKSY